MRSPGDAVAMAGKVAAVLVAIAALVGSGAADAAAAPCPTAVSLGAAAGIQEQAMLCLTNAARAKAGEAALEPAADLTTSAEEKADDLLACDEFSHYACDREFTYWIREAGYLSADCWRVGENLAWGTGEYGSVNAIFRAWMRSPEHRRNILGDYRQTGIDLEVGMLGGLVGAHVWTQHFGSHCEAQAQAQ